GGGGHRVLGGDGNPNRHRGPGCPEPRDSRGGIAKIVLAGKIHSHRHGRKTPVSALACGTRTRIANERLPAAMVSRRRRQTFFWDPRSRRNVARRCTRMPSGRSRVLAL